MGVDRCVRLLPPPRFSFVTTVRNFGIENATFREPMGKCQQKRVFACLRRMFFARECETCVWDSEVRH